MAAQPVHHLRWGGSGAHGSSNTQGDGNGRGKRGSQPRRDTPAPLLTVCMAACHPASFVLTLKSGRPLPPCAAAVAVGACGGMAPRLEACTTPNDRQGCPHEPQNREAGKRLQLACLLSLVFELAGAKDDCFTIYKQCGRAP